MDRALDRRAVVKRAICRTEILKDVSVCFATHFSVHARGKRIGNPEIVPGGTTDGYAQPAERKMIGGTVGVFNNELWHFLEGCRRRSGASDSRSNPHEQQRCRLSYRANLCHARSLRPARNQDQEEQMKLDNRRSAAAMRVRCRDFRRRFARCVNRWPTCRE